MKRRDVFKIFPLSLAGACGLVNSVSGQNLKYNHSGVDAYKSAPVPGSPESLEPLAIRYTKAVRDKLLWIKENQSENLMEAAYAIARTVSNKNTCWATWDMGHSCTFDIFPERNGVPEIFYQGFDLSKCKNGDLFLTNVQGQKWEEIRKKGTLIIGAPAPWGGDARNPHYLDMSVSEQRIKPFADVWIETNIDSIGAIMQVPGMPAPVGPVSGIFGMVTFWMMVGDACRILARDGKSLPVSGDEPKISGDKVKWITLNEPIMDDYFENIMLQIEMIGAELGDIGKIADMAVDTVLNGGNVYCYSRYSASLATEAQTRRGGLAMTQGVYVENGKLVSYSGELKGSAKDMVIMGIFEPDDEVDLTSLDSFRKMGMKVVSMGPVTRDIKSPAGRTVPKETDVHVGRMCDTYGLYAVKGFERRICPTSGALLNQIFWATVMEIIDSARRKTGNVPGVFFSAAVKDGRDHMYRMHEWQRERKY